MKQNNWRAQKVDALMCALTASFEKVSDAGEQIEKAISGLLIPASHPAEYGFRVSDYRYYAQRYQARIDGYNRPDGSRRYGLQETVTHKTSIVGRINKKLQRAYGPAVKSLHEKRKSILADISDIKARIEIYNQVINHLNSLAEKFSKREKVLIQPVTKTAVNERKDYRVCPECGEEFIPVVKGQSECSFTCALIRAGGGPDQF